MRPRSWRVAANRRRAARPAIVRAAPRPQRSCAAAARTAAERLTAQYRAVEPMRVEEFCCGHSPSPRQSARREPQYAAARRDVDAAAPPATYLAGAAGRTSRGHRLPDAQLLPVPARLRDRPRIECAHLPIDLARRAPVDRGFLLADLRRVRHAFGRLRRGAAVPVRIAERLEQRLRAQCREPIVQRPRVARDRSACALSSTGPVSRPASICMMVTPVSRVTGQHRALDRRRTAPARQQRGVDVDAAEPRVSSTAGGRSSP